jgi:quercetin dioxygenase-like cupin family protein
MTRAAGRLVLLAALVGAMGAVSSWGQEGEKGKQEHIFVSPGDEKWGEGPPSLPPGAKVAVLEGDPKKEGFFVMRVKIPAGYKVMPHWHPAYERQTIISGAFNLGLGEKFDEGKGRKLVAGSYFSIPPKTAHFAFVKEETIIQINTMGPWTLTYLNPEDDPRNKK